MKDTRNRLTIVAGVVITVLTGIAFWLSYAHLHDVALRYGLAGSTERAWAWPATLDLFIVAGEIMMLVAAMGRRRDPWAIGLTVAGSVGSVALNVLGVGEGANALQYIVAAIPPSAALLAFGALMRQVHSAVQKPVAAPVPSPKPVPVPVVEETVEEPEKPAEELPEPPKEEPKPVPAALTKKQQEITMFDYYTRGEKASDAAKAAGVGDATAYRRFKVYRQEAAERELTNA